MELAGINYIEPKVSLLHATPLVNSELAARTAYNSFEHSEHAVIRTWDKESQIEDIDDSELIDSLCHVYFHSSVIEHINLTFSIRDISRSCLQELARHRIASYTVKSTRYTMSDIINIYIAETAYNPINTIPSDWYYTRMLELDMFVTTDLKLNRLHIQDIWNKLRYQEKILTTKEFVKLATTKEGFKAYRNNKVNYIALYNILKKLPKKRNIGDAFKFIVNENWKVDLVMTINLRSLSNFYKLRDSGAAYFLIRALAIKMKEVTPRKYLKLIVKEKQDD
jgi:thymidylate synthase (FAD)